LPKKGLEAALSAQICSLSKPAVGEIFAGTKYGRDQLLWSWTRSAVTSSMCETVRAKLLLIPLRSIGVSVRFVAIVEK
jgi:hypothetical protein